MTVVMLKGERKRQRREKRVVCNKISALLSIRTSLGLLFVPKMPPMLPSLPRLYRLTRTDGAK